MTDYPKIKSVHACVGEVLAINFDLDESRPSWYSVRLHKLIDQNKSLHPLREDKLFYYPTVEEFGGAIEWKNGEIGIGGDQLYNLAKFQAGEFTSENLLELWKFKGGLTNKEMANSLELSERTIVNYLKDPASVSKVVKLAVHQLVADESYSNTTYNLQT